MRKVDEACQRIQEPYSSVTDETAGYAGRLADRFNEHFGEHEVFRDIDSLEPGLDFAEAIERAVDSSEVLVAVIGKNWVTATDAAGQKRLENPDDYVRQEIAAALKRNIRVVPLLVQGASMPSADELPDDLAPLSRRNAFELHDASWSDDVRRLIATLDRVLARRPVEEGPARDSSVNGVVEPVRTRGTLSQVLTAIVTIVVVLLVIILLLQLL